VTTPAPAGIRWGTPITSIAATRVGATVVAHLVDGSLRCAVEGIVEGAVEGTVDGPVDGTAEDVEANAR
jgi:hypothetical protein